MACLHVLHRLKPLEAVAPFTSPSIDRNGSGWARATFYGTACALWQRVLLAQCGLDLSAAPFSLEPVPLIQVVVRVGQRIWPVPECSSLWNALHTITAPHPQPRQWKDSCGPGKDVDNAALWRTNPSWIKHKWKLNINTEKTPGCELCICE